MTKQKTLIDVAAAAGVSKMTASRALRGSKDVSTGSRDRVVAAAKKLDTLEITWQRHYLVHGLT